jgi:hypothetical protein
MTTELPWRVSTAASGLYAAAMHERHAPLVDPRLAKAILQPASELIAALESAGIPLWRFVEQAVPLAAAIGNRRELAALAARRASGNRPTEELVTRLSANLAGLDSAVSQAIPNAGHELELRSAPLREQWQARGPGLLVAIGRATVPELLSERADVLVVHPVTGGGGEPYLRYSTVSIEGVLANPHSRLPEVVRLGWLVSTLRLGLPAFSEGIAPGRLVWVAKLSMLPAALDAAEDVELAQSDAGVLRLALAAWHLAEHDASGGAEVEVLAEPLERWWRTFREAPTTWTVAMAALDRMLPGGPS